MKLTDLFGSDKQITDAGRNGQADYARTAAMNRQIRSLVPGQTIQGEVVSRNGSEIQIKLSDDMLLNARLDQNMNIEVGKNMTFEVRNNGRALTLSPLFANMATDANALKALDMAFLPVNQATVDMTRQMMNAGLSIDRNSLQQVFREINAFPQAKTSDIVDLHKLALPVTEGNVEQMASYKNLTYQLITGMNDVFEALPEALQGMVQTGNVEGAAALYGEILSLMGELPAGEGAEGMAGMNTPDAAADGGAAGTSAAAGEAAGTPANAGGEAGASAAAGGAAGMPVDAGNAGAGEAVSQKGQAAERGNALSQAVGLLEELARNTTGGTENSGQMPGNTPLEALARELSGLSGQPMPENPQAAQLLQTAAQLLKRGIAEHDTGLLRELLGSRSLQKVMDQNLRELWSIRPEQVADPRQVEELYRRMDRQVKGMLQAFESAGQTSAGAYRATANMAQNLDFLQQVNQMYAYVQLPLRLQHGSAHGDLYVYTNKKNLAAEDGRVSALLHLDMEHLGPVDVYVAMQSQRVSTQFYVKDDSMLDFLSKHMDLLTERLQKRGYDCSCRMQVRGKDETGENGSLGKGGIHSLLAQAGHMKLAQYAFDVRA